VRTLIEKRLGKPLSLHAIDLATGDAADLSNLLQGVSSGTNLTPTGSVDFMADGDLWGATAGGGEHRQGAVFRIGLPR
jgi:uncharacterized repeat protein (TIGR03803 family)